MKNKELAILANMSDSDIDLSDQPETMNWSTAERGKFYRPVKEQIRIRVDTDVMAWFQFQEGKYQSRINQLLRDYTEQKWQVSPV
jgi:uncharacterized protein (DUF4415 family)